MFKFTLLLVSLKPKISIQLCKGFWGSNMGNKAATSNSTVKWLYLKIWKLGCFLISFMLFLVSPYLFSLEIMKYRCKNYKCKLWGEIIQL